MPSKTTPGLWAFTFVQKFLIPVEEVLWSLSSNYWTKLKQKKNPYGPSRLSEMHFLANKKKDQPGSRNAIIKYFKINVTTQNSMCNHFPSLWEKNDASFEKYWLSREENIYICTMICQCILTIPLPSPRVNLFNPPVNLRHHNHIYTDISPW